MFDSSWIRRLKHRNCGSFKRFEKPNSFSIAFILSHIHFNLPPVFIHSTQFRQISAGPFCIFGWISRPLHDLNDFQRLILFWWTLDLGKWIENEVFFSLFLVQANAFFVVVFFLTNLRKNDFNFVSKVQLEHRFSLDPLSYGYIYWSSLSLSSNLMKVKKKQVQIPREPMLMQYKYVFYEKYKRITQLNSAEISETHIQFWWNTFQIAQWNPINVIHDKNSI